MKNWDCRRAMTKHSEHFYEIVGAIHLHSTFSDGSLSIPEIAAIAERKNLDYLMFSDHNTLQPKHQGFEGWYGNVFVLIGCEINDPEDRNHYLAFRIEKEVKPGLRAKEYVREVKKMGGFGIIAHPAEKRQFSEAYPPYPWTDWDVDDFDGIEIWNQLSEWMEGITRRNVPWRILHPLKSIRFPVWETLERWDRFNQRRRVVGIGGIDVHAHRIKLFGFIPLEIYPYKVQFKSIRTHILIKKPLRSENGSHLSRKEAERVIFEALNSGRCFVTNHALGSGEGFQFWAEREKGVYMMGSRILDSGWVTFTVKVPRQGNIRFLKDGKIIKQIKGQALVYKGGGKGVYRVEVFRKRRGWIYSNPIVLTKSMRG